MAEAGRTTVSRTLLDIRVIPRAKRSAVAGTRGDAWLVRLQAPPVDGAANEELMTLLAEVLGVSKRAVSIVSGETSRQKRVQVIGIGAEAAHERLSIASAGPDSTARS
jgi:uncharacterized protein (TIGR00251 family)